MSPAVGADGSAPLYRLEDLVVSVGGRTLLGPVDLDLAPGRVIGLIGHNGSGKSTLIRALARLQPPSAGTVKLGGRPIEAWERRAFAREVAYMSQQAPVASGLTVRELVRLGRYPWTGALGRVGPADREAIARAMALADIEAYGDRLVETLSGGERQRAWLAALIAQQARTLLLDEPIAALDIGHQIAVMGLLQRLSAAEGLGILVVLHDINLTCRFCDDILALRGGRIVARGGPEEIMEPSVLARIYDAPFGLADGRADARLLAYPI